MIELDEHGRVIYVEVIQPIGHGFDEAALTAVRAMTFTPAQTEAGPVGVAFEFAYGFTFQPPEPEPDEPAAPLPVNLDGTLREMGTRGFIAGAKVVIVDTDLVAVSDDKGFFEFRGVPVGSHSVKVLSQEHVGVTKQVEIVEGEITGMELWLRGLQYRENEGVGTYERKREEVTRRTLTIEEIKRVPGTFGDPLKVIQTLPGAARSPFGTGILIIRGSNPEDSGIYVDGVRIPIIYHLTGTTSVLTPDLIESVDYLPGGYGSQYGRSMGGVIDVKTKSTFDENGKVSFGADILDSQIYFEGMIGSEKKHGLAVGARRSYVDVFIPLFTPEGNYTIKPRYWDYSMKYLHEAGQDRKGQVFVYGFNDVLRLGTPAEVSQGPDADFQGDVSIEYASHRVVANYQTPLSDHWSLNTTPSVGIDYSYTNFGESLKLDSINSLVELRSELAFEPNEHISLAPGVDFIGAGWKFEFTAPFTLAQADDPLAERESVFLDGKGAWFGPDIYLNAKWRPLNDPDKWLIAPSIRGNITRQTVKGSVTGDAGAPWMKTSADPRLATRFQLTDSFVIKGASGIYHQPPQPSESVGLGSDNNLKYEYAWNSSLGFEHQISPIMVWDVDLFYRDMQNLVEFDDSFGSFGDNTWVNSGLGRAYGGELIVRHNPANNFFGWVSYTLSKSERKVNRDQEEWQDFDFDQTHIFSAQGGYDLPKDFGVSAQVQYVTGNPDSPFNAGIYDFDWDSYNGFRVGPSNSERLPPFFQTSVRLDKLWTFRTWQMTTYVDLLNTVRGVNPEFTIYSYDYSDFAYVRGLPFIPNIGIEGTFYPGKRE